MKANQTYVGKIYTHTTLGKVKVQSIVDGSRVMVNILEIDRGIGWNEITQSYTGRKIKMESGVGWYRGENYSFGTKHQVHIKELK